MPDLPPVICIDGPAGAGKGTLGRLLAQALGWHLLESGLLYRLLALVARRSEVATGDGAALEDCLQHMTFAFQGLTRHTDATTPPRQDAQPEQPPWHCVISTVPGVWLNGEDVSVTIAADETGRQASQIAGLGGVRKALIGVQRALRMPPGLVAEGRDMGTVIFPDAALKIFLTASAEVRAQRRHKQLIDKGVNANLHDLHSSISQRDVGDSRRAVAPLKAAADAVSVDNTHPGTEQVLGAVLALARERGLCA